MLFRSDEFLMPVAWHALADHFAIEHAEGRKQRGRASTLVVVRHRSAAALLHGKTGLRAIERLDLAFLVDAQDKGFVRRIEIQADDIVELVDKVLVSADLAGLDEMGLEVMLRPNALNAGRTDALRVGHRAHAPMRPSRRLGVQRRVDDGTHFPFRDAGQTTGTWGVLFQPRHPQRQKTFSPQLNGWPGDAHLTCDVLIGNPVAGHRDDSSTLHQPQGETPTPCPCGQGGPLFRRQNDRRGSSDAESIVLGGALSKGISETLH